MHQRIHFLQKIIKHFTNHIPCKKRKKNVVSELYNTSQKIIFSRWIFNVNLSVTGIKILAYYFIINEKLAYYSLHIFIISRQLFQKELSIISFYAILLKFIIILSTLTTNILTPCKFSPANYSIYSQK